MTAAEDHLTPRLGLEDVLILSVTPGSAADKAGLHATRVNESGTIVFGDQIVAIDGEPVRTTSDMFPIIDARRAGNTLQLTVIREGREVEVEVTLELLP